MMDQTSFASALPQAVSPMDIAQASKPTMPHLGGAKTLQQARAKANEFEGMFLSQMMKPMFESVGIDPMFGGGEGEKMFRTMLVDEYGKLISKSGGVGVADAVMVKILEMQGYDTSEARDLAKEIK